MAAQDIKIPPRRAKRQRGVTLVEMAASALIVSFVMAASLALYITWQKQILISRNYSQAQTDLRTAFRSLLRTIRHGNSVVSSVNDATKTLNGQASGTGQIIVNVPQTGNNPAINVLYYKDTAGNLYYKREGDTSGTLIISGVTAFTITYYQSVASTGSGSASSITTTQVNSSPASATEVQISLTVRSGSTANNTNDAAVTTVQSYVTLRNTGWLHL